MRFYPLHRLHLRRPLNRKFRSLRAGARRVRDPSCQLTSSRFRSTVHVMNTCPKCHSSLSEGATSCQSCGAPMINATAAPTGATTSTTSGQLAPNIASLLCYVAGFISGIIFLNLDPYRENPHIRFHAWQSILLNVASMTVWFALMISGFTLGFFHLLFLIPLLSAALNLAIVALWVVLLVKAYNGEKWKVPVIGDWAEKQAA